MVSRTSSDSYFWICRLMMRPALARIPGWQVERPLGVDDSNRQSKLEDIARPRIRRFINNQIEHSVTFPVFCTEECQLTAQMCSKSMNVEEVPNRNDSNGQPKPFQIDKKEFVNEYISFLPQSLLSKLSTWTRWPSV
jgi:hypothetical protein